MSSGQARGFGLAVDFIAGLRQRQIERVAFRDQRIAFAFQRRHRPKRIVALCNQRRDLRLETGDLGLRRRELCGRVVALNGQSRDQSILFLGLSARIGQCGTQRSDLRFQTRRPFLFQTQRLGQGSNFGRQRVQFGRLSRNRFPQHKLHHHKDGENEHQNEQKPGHRVNETGPDGCLKPLSCAARQSHDLALLCFRLPLMPAHRLRWGQL